MPPKPLTVVLPYNHDENALRTALKNRYGVEGTYRILRKSIDARQHRQIKVEYAVTTDSFDPANAVLDGVAGQRERLSRALANSPKPKVAVVGAGPGGLFAAYWLHLHGLQPVLIEQGPPLRERLRDMARFMKAGELHPYSNICFGAGGAGAYSDGKLITRIRSPFIAFVMETFVRYGAPENIRYLYNPHLGSNKIRRCIALMLEDFQKDGIDVRYDTRLTDFGVTENGGIKSCVTSGGELANMDAVFLASGHSSRETYAMLRSKGVAMSLKEFAIGVRIEHPSDSINCMQYGWRYREHYPDIEAAQYKLAASWDSGARSVYSFCMCPGGYVLNASSASDGVVTNGMSNYLKAGRFSNAGVVVNVSKNDLEREGYGDMDGSLAFQRHYEERCRASVNPAGRCNVIPGQRLSDFLNGAQTSALLRTSCPNPVASAPLHTLLPGYVVDTLRRGFSQFDKKMRGFGSLPQAQLFAIESRTSSPYRIDRDPATLQSLSHPQLYPVGEGAGYAGGITSAAVDGIRCAQAFLARYIETADFAALTGNPPDTHSTETKLADTWMAEK